MITITQNDKDEWSRLATSAYTAGHNTIGHKYSAAAAMPALSKITPGAFEDLQRPYREWLNWNTYRYDFRTDFGEKMTAVFIGADLFFVEADGGREIKLADMTTALRSKAEACKS